MDSAGDRRPGSTAQAGGGRYCSCATSSRLLCSRWCWRLLADGLTDAARARHFYEGRFRQDSERSAKWLAHQGGKIERALARSWRDGPPVEGAPDIGQIALACALGYLDLRFSGAWRATHPRLVEWLEDFADKVPAFSATTPA